jgi:hypothetical protein
MGDEEEETLIDEAARLIVDAAVEIVGECPPEIFALIMSRATQAVAARGVMSSLEKGQLDYWLENAPSDPGHLRVVCCSDSGTEE